MPHGPRLGPYGPGAGNLAVVGSQVWLRVQPFGFCTGLPGWPAGGALGFGGVGVAGFGGVVDGFGWFGWG